MTKLEDIEKAVARLGRSELARFRVWFDAFEAARFDEKIERDAASGKLDRFAEQARSDHRASHLRHGRACPGHLRLKPGHRIDQSIPD
jgi:hypothetical protein